MDWIDLTRPMDETLTVYAEPGYSDPPFSVESWCDTAGQGYAVQRLALGTQCGTHIDAPAHMAEGGATLEALPVSALVGRYVTLRRGEVPQRGAATILFVDGTVGPITRAGFDAALALGFPVWVMAGGLQVAGEGPLFLHRALARAGVYLVEDLDEVAVAQLPDRGEIIALPLRLVGTGGSPCRVLARGDELR
jgi:kynurenine formamidase